jgi:Uncharacterized protein involved in exopolysaccharide biosynthesis
MEEEKKIAPQQQPYLEEEYDEIDIMELLRKLLKEWRLILKWCGIAAVAGLVIGFSIPKVYTVNSKMAPESVSKSAGGSLGSLASLAGISLGSMNTADAVYPDLYPDIVSSTPFVVELFPAQVDFKYKKENMSSDFYTYLKDYNRSPWWGKVFSAPFKALGWVMGLMREKEEKVEGYAVLDPSALTQEQADIAKAIRESIVLSVDKKTSVITLTVSAQDPRVAAKISEEVISRLQTYVTNYRTEKSRQDLEYYENLYEEAKEEYFASQQRYASYVDRNQGVILQRVKTEQERLQNEMNLNYQLYNACAQQLQTAKAKVQQETPVFTVINPPQVPLKRDKPSKITILVACIFLGAAVAAVWILWGRDALAKLRKKDDEEEAAAEKQ